jgi:DNA-binding XRE family transcriptional regulator
MGSTQPQSSSRSVPRKPLTSAARRRTLDQDTEKVTFIPSSDHPLYAVVPIATYAKLLKHEAFDEAERVLSDPKAEWIDWEDAVAILAGSRIAAARKKRGMTQAQLGKLLGIPQSQVSRLEKNPDRTSVAMLKRVAAALKVDVSHLLDNAE